MHIEPPPEEPPVQRHAKMKDHRHRGADSAGTHNAGPRGKRKILLLDFVDCNV